MKQFCLREQILPSYKLSDVAENLLPNVKKNDLHDPVVVAHMRVGSSYNKHKHYRNKLAIKCLKDAYLSL